MKIKLLMLGLLGLVSATTFAQKGELKNAQDSYDSFTVSNASAQKLPLLAAKAKASLNDAKTSIDKASANEKTAALPQTFALKGAIYSALASQDSVATTAEPLISAAQEAIKKAKELDTKGENKKLIDQADNNLEIYYSAIGVKQYQAAKYDLAYNAFDNYRQASNDDTTAVYYTALAASNAGSKDPKYYPLAITNYNKLLATKYSQNPKIYKYLTSLYLNTKDTASAMKTIAESVAKYPTNAELRELEIRIGLQAGKEKEIVGKIDAAIANDPKNKALYYYEGLIYSRIGDADDDKALKAKDNASKTTLSKSALDSYAKAVDFYKKSIAIDPDYFDANLNLGYTLVRPGIDIYNEARNLPATASQKDYVAMRLKADAQFDLALPYLQKAADLNPKSVDALTNLRNYYRGKYDPAHTADNKAKGDDLKKQIDALPSATTTGKN